MMILTKRTLRTASSLITALVLISTLLLNQNAHAQGLRHIDIKTEAGLEIEQLHTETGLLPARSHLPLFSVLVDEQLLTSNQARISGSDGSYTLRFSPDLTAILTITGEVERGWKAELQFTNHSDTTLTIENVVPFGEHPDHTYITGSGPWSLARTKLYRPGKAPVGVILPDNAWEMGYGAVHMRDSISAVAITRRTASEQADIGRWESRLKPGGTVTYTFHADVFTGAWQNGLRLMFRDRWLYDLEKFDNTLFEREDLTWIRDKYLVGLQMAWDHRFYNDEIGRYRLDDFFADADTLMGGWGVYGIWPTWPRLGLDQRNQWDLYRDLPGGLEALNDLAGTARSHDTRFFIAYNPWDQSTRNEDPYQGMASLIDRIGADGVVLDTRGSSSYKLQAAADSVRDGVVMFSEGMAVPEDMPGIISGRVHNAIQMPPPLNLHKVIKPDFAIYRVGDTGDGRLHRGISLSLFNGYGYEFNLFAQERPPWMRGAMRYAGEIARVLRENSDNFHSRDWTPLIETTRDSIWANKWPGADKTLYTVFSLDPAGHNGPLFEAPRQDNMHYVDLWNHTEVQPDTTKHTLRIPVNVASFDASWLGTRREGQVAAVAALPRLLETSTIVDSLYIETDRGAVIRIWAGEPSYSKKPVKLEPGKHTMNLTDRFGKREGKFVIQLMDEENQLLDERIEHIKPGAARLVNRPAPTEPVDQAPQGMVKVHGGIVDVSLTNREQFISYPDTMLYENRPVGAFFMDRYPITNAEYKRFVDETNYQPGNTKNYLKHWENGSYPEGKGDHPVVWVSLEDARRYAAWAGKRLPTELEWQLAAQGTDNRKWPWGAEFDSSACNVAIGHTTPVDAFPKGASPYGVEDMVGNVWQLTGDVYQSAAYEFVIIRGGSYYKPTSSWWYVEGGPQPLTKQQMLLRVAPGYDRSATVGFRLVKDKL